MKIISTYTEKQLLIQAGLVSSCNKNKLRKEGNTYALNAEQKSVESTDLI